MKTNSKIFNGENLVYLILWLIVFSMPVFLSTGENQIDWIRVQHEIIRMFPFFLIFLIHNFLLFRLFRRKKYVNYVVLTLILISTMSYVASFNAEIFRIIDIPVPQGPRPRTFNRQIEFFNQFFYNLIFSILIVGFNNAFKIMTYWFEEKRNNEKLAKQKVQAELEMLRNQISPHFLMNTLNNIHALIDYDSENAKDSVIRLSKLMRVLLYETENSNYSLSKEIAFLNDYIGLMKIRLAENVKVEFEFPDKNTDFPIPPLLFVSFVENSFKHGILAMGDSFIDIKFNLGDDNLYFEISNSVSQTTKSFDNPKIGLENSRRRLDAVYGSNYNLEIIEKQDSFTVKLKIPRTWR
ncbi:MAG: histidine kinase [Bacteroidales bacterium]|nr:histidine kinase [Bacteroidales bacterium]